MAAGTPRTLERTQAARAPTLHRTSRVHAQANAPLVRAAKRPNLGPIRRTRALLRAARLAIPLESTGARRRRTISCDGAAIRTAGPATWWITSCRSPAVVPTRPATCNGKRPRKGRQRTGWSDADALAREGTDRREALEIVSFKQLVSPPPANSPGRGLQPPLHTAGPPARTRPDPPPETSRGSGRRPALCPPETSPSTSARSSG